MLFGFSLAFCFRRNVEWSLKKVEAFTERLFRKNGEQAGMRSVFNNVISGSIIIMAASRYYKFIVNSND